MRCDRGKRAYTGATSGVSLDDTQVVVKADVAEWIQTLSQVHHMSVPSGERCREGPALLTPYFDGLRLSVSAK